MSRRTRRVRLERVPYESQSEPYPSSGLTKRPYELPFLFQNRPSLSTPVHPLSYDVFCVLHNVFYYILLVLHCDITINPTFFILILYGLESLHLFFFKMSISILRHIV